MSKLAIITITYNAIESIERTMRSVLGQEYKDYEYVIVDGGSTDGTVEIIKKYEGRFRIKGILFRYISEKDDGIYDAMNKGIGMVSKDSEWITFLNADDHYCDKYVLQDVFTKYDLSEIDCIYGDAIIKRENGQRYRKKACPIETINYKVPFVHQSLFADRKWIGQNPFSNRWKLAADYEQWVRIYLAGGRFKRIARNIVVYDAAGTSGRRFKEYVQEMLRIQEEYGLTSNYRMHRLIRNYIIPELKENKIIYCLYALCNRVGGYRK